MLFYCGFESHLRFPTNCCQTIKPLERLQLLEAEAEAEAEKGQRVEKAFLGWCSLFLLLKKKRLLYIPFNCPEASSSSTATDITSCLPLTVDVSALECGTKQTFLVSSDGKLSKWSSSQFKEEPEELLDFAESGQENGLKVQQVSVGSSFVCVLFADGRVKGIDEEGQVVTFDGHRQGFAAIACGHEHLLLLTTNGQVLTYGRGSKGQLGLGDLEDSLEDARSVEALEGVEIVQVAAGGWHSVVLSKLGDIYVWGWNESGQLGLPRGEKVTMKVLPTLLDIEATFMAISAGSRHSMSVTAEGLLYGWGWNKWGQIGVNPKEYPSIYEPLLIPFTGKVQSITCKYWSTLIETL